MYAPTLVAAICRSGPPVHIRTALTESGEGLTFNDQIGLASGFLGRRCPCRPRRIALA
jgi:hypothetical protein